MSENQVYLIKSGDGSFVEETEAIIGISGGKVGIGTTVPEASLHVTGDVKVGGNLSVDGTLTTINSSEITVDDKNIELGSVDNPTNITADGGGLTLRGTTNKTILWNNATDAWEFSEHVRISDGMQFQGDELRARDTDGLYLGDSAGSGIFIQQGGDVLIAANLFVKGSNVSSDIDVISGDLDTLESVVDSATGDIDTISGVVSGLLSAEVDDDTAFESLSGSVDVISGDLDALEAVVDSATGDIDVLSGVVDGILSNDQLGKWIENESEAGEIYYNQGNVGIATTNPSSELDVVGTIKSTNAQFSNSLTLGGNPVLTGTVEDLGKWSEDTANNIYYYGNVGIGTSVPSPEKLHVQGDVYAGTIDSSKISVGDEFVVESNGVIGGGTPTNGEVLMWNGATWAPAANNPGGLLTGEIPKSFIQQMSVGSSVHAVEFSQELGGIPAVCTQLEIQGDGEIIPYVLSGVSETGFHVVFAKEIPSLGYRLHTSFGGKDVYWETGVNSIYFDRGDVKLSDNLIVSGNLNVSGPQGIKINGNDVLTGTIDDLGKWEDDAAIDGNIYYNAGSVGIGTESPNNSYDLDVNGIAYVNDIRFNSVGGTSAGATNDIIKWDGSAWIAASPDTLGIGGSSSSTEVPNSFVSNVPQGTESFAINWTSSIGTLDNVPRIAASLEINGEGEIIPYTTSGISQTGYHVIFSEPVPTTNYRIHTVFGGKDVHWELGTDDLQYNDRNVSIQRNLTVGGDLTINGNTTTINTQTLEVEDNNIVIAKNLASDSLSDAGITWGNDDTVKLGFTSNQGFAFSGGNVGIGTTDPNVKLDVHGISYFRTPTGGALISSWSTGASTGVSQPVLLLRTNETSNADRIKLHSDGKSYFNAGNVGIGTTSPNAKLEIKRGKNGFPNPDISEDDVTALRVRGNDNAVIDMGVNGGSGTWIQARNRTLDSTQYHLALNPLGGNVGIGTTNPGAPLHIKTSNTTDTLLLESTGDSNLNAPDLILYRNSATPADADNLGIIKFRGVNDGTIGVNRSDIDYALIQSEITDASNNAEKGSLSFWTRGVGGVNKRMTIDSNGNVGIGTTSPDATLHIKASDDSENALALWVVNKAHNNSIITAYENGNVKLGSFCYDDASGSVGIGTTSPDSALHVMQSGDVNDGITLQQVNYAKKLNLRTNSAGELIVDVDDGTVEAMRIKSDGNVGIGTTNPVTTLDVRGTGQAIRGYRSTTDSVRDLFTLSSDVGGTNQTKFKIEADGKAYTGGSLLTSDDRLKHNEQEIVGAVETLSKITPKKYIKTSNLYEANHDFQLDAGGNPIDENGKLIAHHIEAGVIAQQVLNVPELAFLVREEKLDADGNTEWPYSLDYNSLFTYAIAAIQEQQSIIEDLKSQNESQQSTIDSLVSRIENLENK